MDPKDVVRAGYDKISHTYRGDAIDLDNPEHARYAAWVNELLDRLPAGAPVLDLGCGNGIPTSKLLTDAGYVVTGVDISPVQIARAQTLVPQAQFFCADMSHIAFPPSVFAAIIALYAIIHVPLAEQPDLFAALYGWLRPRGYLMVTVGAEAWTGTEADWLDVPDAPMYWSHADAATYQQWLTECGFSIHWSRFIPEGEGGHTLVLAEKPGSHYGTTPYADRSGRANRSRRPSAARDRS